MRNLFQSKVPRRRNEMVLSIWNGETKEDIDGKNKESILKINTFLDLMLRSQRNIRTLMLFQESTLG